jgi:WD40 repeat protein
LTNDNKFFLTSSWDGSIKIWDSLKRTCVDSISKAHENSIMALDITSDDKKFVSVSYDRRIKVWDFKTRKLIKKVDEAHAGIQTIFYQGNRVYYLLEASAQRQIFSDRSIRQICKNLEHG